MPKFCKICSDSGKGGAIFRNHNVRERGRVVCPTLLAMECRYCRGKGHTPKFCPKLKEREVRVGGGQRNGNFRTGRHGQRRNIPIASARKMPPAPTAPHAVCEKKQEMVATAVDDDDDDDVIHFDMTGPNVLWGDGPGEDEPFQKNLLERSKMWQ